MIATSRKAKLVAVLLAGTAHAAVALAILPEPNPVKIEGASGGAEVRLGSSFADMVAGVMTAQDAPDQTIQEELPEPLEPEVIERAEAIEQPNAVERSVKPETAAMNLPKKSPKAPAGAAAPRLQIETVKETEFAKYSTPTLLETDLKPAALKADKAKTSEKMRTENVAAAAPALARVAHTAVAVAPTAHSEAPQPQKNIPLVRAKTAMEARKSETQVPEPRTVSEALPAQKETETLQDEAKESPAISRSLRPKVRSKEFETANKPKASSKIASKATKKKTTKKTAAVQRGNSNRNARAGSTQGKVAAKARASGSGGKKRTAGNAAASNYGGLVMRCVSRAGRPRARGRGTAMVSFRISASGGVGSVSLARSSGTAALDSAALKIIRRAGPCPKPPAGARRSFTIAVKSR